MYPHVATGFGDSNAYLRELTLKSMLVLAPKLSQKTLNQSLLKFLAKLQVWACPHTCRFIWSLWPSLVYSPWPLPHHGGADTLGNAQCTLGL